MATPRPTKPKTIKSLEDLGVDQENVNVGNERGDSAITWSLAELGAGRSIVADRRGVVLAGDKTRKAAKKLKLPVRVVQTDGNELVVVQRMDLDLQGKGEESSKARRLSVSDNRTQQVSYTEDQALLLTHLGEGVGYEGLYTPEEIALISAAHEQDQLSRDLAGMIEAGSTAGGGETEENKPPRMTDGYRSVTLMFTVEQEEIIRAAVNKAKEQFKVETSPEAFFHIAQAYLNAPSGNVPQRRRNVANR